MGTRLDRPHGDAGGHPREGLVARTEAGAHAASQGVLWVAPAPVAPDAPPVVVPRSLEGLRPLLDLLSEPMVAIDRFGNCLFMNHAFVDVVGEEPVAPAVGRPPAWVAPESEELWRFIIDWFATPRPVDVEVTGSMSIDLVVRTRSGRQTMQVRWNVIRCDDGAIECLLGLLGVSSGVRIDASPVAELQRMVDEMRQLVGQLKPDSRRKRKLDAAPGDADDAGATPGPDPQLEHYRARLSELSDREREVLVYLLEGKRVGTIAQLLYLSEHTVRNHLKSVYRKLGVHSVAELREQLTPSGRTGFVGSVPLDDTGTVRRIGR